MKVLVAHATKYGATEGIAERTALNMRERGLSVDARRVDSVHDADGYDAFVVALWAGAR